MLIRAEHPLPSCSVPAVGHHKNWLLEQKGRLRSSHSRKLSATLLELGSIVGAGCPVRQTLRISCGAARSASMFLKRWLRLARAPAGPCDCRAQLCGSHKGGDLTPTLHGDANVSNC